MYDTLIFILLLLFIIGIDTLIFSLAYYFSKKVKLNKRDLDLKEYEINLKANITFEISNLLEEIIQDCLNEYIILNIAYRQDLTYINADLENEICREVSYMVLDRLSLPIKNKISLLYKSENLGDIIGQKVYLATMNYVINNNKAKK